MDTIEDQAGSAQSTNVDDTPGLERFTAHIGEKFDVSLPGEPLQLELVQAKELSGHGGIPDEDSFSLVFRAASNCPLADGPVALEHDKLGWIVVFLVAMGEDRDGRYFEAIID